MVFIIQTLRGVFVMILAGEKWFYLKLASQFDITETPLLVAKFIRDHKIIDPSLIFTNIKEFHSKLRRYHDKGAPKTQRAQWQPLLDQLPKKLTVEFREFYHDFQGDMGQLELKVMPPTPRPGKSIHLGEGTTLCGKKDPGMTMMSVELINSVPKESICKHCMHSFELGSEQHTKHEPVFKVHVLDNNTHLTLCGQGVYRDTWRERKRPLETTADINHPRICGQCKKVHETQGKRTQKRSSRQARYSQRPQPTIMRGENVFVIAGTGSRQLVHKSTAVLTQHIIWLVGQLHRAVEMKGEVKVISGMAEGFDEMLALAAIQAGIPFVAALPSSTYGNYYWRDHSLTGRNRLAEFQYMISRAVEVVNVSPHFGREANFKRNEWMVDNADYMLVCNPTTSGTAQCYKYIREVGKPHYVMNW